MAAHAARADTGNTTRPFLERRSARDCLLHHALHSTLLSRLKAGQQRLKLTANPTIQCGSKRVSAKSLPKTGISGNLAGDFRQFRSKVVVSRSFEAEREARERPYFAGFPRL